MTDRRYDLTSAIAAHCALEGELVSEFLMILSTVGTDGSAGSYRIVTGPAAIPLHTRLGLMDVMNTLMDENAAREMSRDEGDDDDD